MIVNFYRLYGNIFFTLDECIKNAVYFANTHEDLTRTADFRIPCDVPLTDRQARAWFKQNFPKYEIHKVNKHYHTEVRERDGDVAGD